MSSSIKDRSSTHLVHVMIRCSFQPTLFDVIFVCSNFFLLLPQFFALMNMFEYVLTLKFLGTANNKCCRGGKSNL